MTGNYIVIEGNDGTGKTTQVEQLANYFRGHDQETVVIEEPGSDDLQHSTPAANYLRDVIKNGSLRRDGEINLALFSAARRELWREVIQPALGRGAVVLAARNWLSTLAYQGYGEGVELERIRKVTALFTSPHYMQPDHTIVLVMNDEAERANRIAKRGDLAELDTFESRGDEFQQRVNDGYLAIAADFRLPIVACVASDGRRKTVEEIQLEIRKLIS